MFSELEEKETDSRLNTEDTLDSFKPSKSLWERYSLKPLDEANYTTITIEN